MIVDLPQTHMHQQKREVFSMTDTSAPHTDPGLEGNEKIEDAILALQQEASQELLAHALTVLRRRMRENFLQSPLGSVSA